MRWRLICLVPMASSMCGGDQVRNTKISVSSYSQAWWWECHGLGLHECCRCWRVTFNWGKHELQRVLWNTAAEHDPLPPETGSQGSVPAWQWPQTHLQDDHCFTEEAEGKGDGLAKHVSRLEPNRTSLGILKRMVEVRKVSNIRQSSWRSGRHESLCLSSYGLISAAAVILQEWLWHQITHQVWYVIKHRNQTLHIQIDR